MAVPLNIRDQRAEKLAKELASYRRTTMTRAVIDALSNELERERKKEPLIKRIANLRQSHFAEGMRGQDMTKAEIDAMWEP